MTPSARFEAVMSLAYRVEYDAEGNEVSRVPTGLFTKTQILEILGYPYTVFDCGCFAETGHTPLCQLRSA